jgi:hypothetical protein
VGDAGGVILAAGIADPPVFGHTVIDPVRPSEPGGGRGTTGSGTTVATGTTAPGGGEGGQNGGTAQGTGQTTVATGTVGKAVAKPNPGGNAGLRPIDPESPPPTAPRSRSPLLAVGIGLVLLLGLGGLVAVAAMGGVDRSSKASPGVDLVAAGAAATRPPASSRGQAPIPSVVIATYPPTRSLVPSPSSVLATDPPATTLEQLEAALPAPVTTGDHGCEARNAASPFADAGPWCWGSGSGWWVEYTTFPTEHSMDVAYGALSPWGIPTGAGAGECPYLEEEAAGLGRHRCMEDQTGRNGGSYVWTDLEHRVVGELYSSSSAGEALRLGLTGDFLLLPKP